MERWAAAHGPDIAAGQPAEDRSDPNYRNSILEMLHQAIARLGFLPDKRSKRCRSRQHFFPIAGLHPQRLEAA